MSQTGPESVSYHRIEKNTPILIQQIIACAVYITNPVNYILLESLYSIDVIYTNMLSGSWTPNFTY